jgi:hypothetical protein
MANGNGSALGNKDYVRLYRAIAEFKHCAPLEMSEQAKDLVGGNVCSYWSQNADYGYVNQLFGYARKLVSPLLMDTARRQDQGGSITRPLRCIKVADEELPWERK